MDDSIISFFLGVLSGGSIFAWLALRYVRHSTAPANTVSAPTDQQAIEDELSILSSQLHDCQQQLEKSRLATEQELNQLDRNHQIAL